jgi:hypothetical protein
MNQVSVGEWVQIQDASGDWHPATALSRVEGTHDFVDGRVLKVHDFPVVWFEATGYNGLLFKAPWPAESVRATAWWR